MNAVDEVIDASATASSEVHSLSCEQKEIIELLQAEIIELSEQTQCVLGSADDWASGSEKGSEHDDQHKLKEVATHLEQLGKAFELSGLGGLAFCAHKIAQNFTALAENKFDATQLSRLEMPIHAWGDFFLAHLQSVAQGSDTEQVEAANLLRFLSQSDLPKPLNNDELASLQEKFSCSDISKINDSNDSLPERVEPAMASLLVDKNVHPDLLEGLLIELPTQASQFEEAINAYIDQQDQQQLARAQRIAHTIKGAANVVAIAGLANLTHYCEGLLETLAKKSREERKQANSALIRAADCLSASAEYLNHEGPAPDEIEEVLQLLLDHLNGKPGTAEPDENFAMPQELAPALSQQNEMTAAANAGNSVETVQPSPASAEETDAANERHIHMPEKTARELLRLSGELQITNNQLGAKTANMEHSLSVADRQHLEIRKMAVELEGLIQTQSAIRAASMKYNEDEIDPLEMERFSELHTFAHRLLELTTDSYESIGGIGGQLKDLAELMHQQRQLNTDNQNILLEMSLVPVSILSSRLSRCVRQTCRLTGKTAKLELEGENLMVDSKVLQRMADPLMHLIRNAIDHGLEAELGERQAKGKAQEGTIKISFRNRGDILEVTCSDDGRGFDYAQIKATAVERGLLDENTPAKEALLNQLLLMPGFSTRSSATQTSGRGIGLDSVFSDVRALKGNFSFNSQQDKGTEFIISVPTSILTSHALLVECRDQQRARTVAIASRAIANIIYVQAQDLIERDGKQFYLLHQTALKKDGSGESEDAKEILVQNLSEALGMYASEDEKIHALLILQSPDSSDIAVGVEKILASQDMVVKPLNRFSYQPPGVVGATILGDGSVSPVIDLQEVPQLLASSQQGLGLHDARARKLLAEREAMQAPLSALIVDDSLSARRSLSQFVTDMGMEVYTAKDGFDAINVMSDKKPSVMLVDLEMPRMNGLELCAHIRAREEYQDIPVIMITSRSTARHKQMAQDAGVTSYLTKPWSDDELLNCIQQQIA